MTLRKQLLLVSLITLCLPWAGLQYIQEMERMLKNAQVQSLRASAKVVAAYLANNPVLAEEIRRFHSAPNNSPIYLHPLPAASLIDGYDEEWQAQAFAEQVFLDPANVELSMAVLGGIYREQIYLYLRLSDPNIRYFTPAMSTPLDSDHLRLTLNRNREIYLFAAGPGRLQAVERKTSGFAPVYHLLGSWIESESGYQVELSLPLDWADKHLGISMHDQQSGSSLANFQQASSPQPLYHSSALQQALTMFRQKGLRMAVSTPEGKLLAIDGSVETRDESQLEPHAFIRWFYQTVIGDKTLPDLGSPLASGGFNTPEVLAASQAKMEKNAAWYKQNTQRVVRLGQAVMDENGERLGLIVLDQSAESLVTMTSSAFYRMLFYSLVSTSFVGLIFLIYASWLSLRIGTLSRAAAAAVSDTGKIAEDFPVLNNRDELGDLSRNYAQLLSRLREYTNYLRTLSSKLSHELRTPLAIVQSSLDNLEHENLSEKAGVYAERAKLGTARLSNILNAMSAASRVEQAISGAEMEKIPCDELLRNLKAAYEDVYKEATFKLRIRDDEGKLACMASGELLVQMLDKLVDNAADFCPSGGIIELGLYRHQGHIVFTVHNQGPPLPKHMHGQLFDSMVSVREKGKGENDGHHLGLGLYIVRLIVDFHRGEVQGYNVPDHSGVIFEVRLPV